MRLFREGHPNAAFLTYERLLKAAGILEDDGAADMVCGQVHLLWAATCKTTFNGPHDKLCDMWLKTLPSSSSLICCKHNTHEVQTCQVFGYWSLACLDMPL